MCKKDVYNILSLVGVVTFVGGNDFSFGWFTATGANTTYARVGL
jgi:hypothetical protein